MRYFIVIGQFEKFFEETCRFAELACVRGRPVDIIRQCRISRRAKNKQFRSIPAFSASDDPRCGLD
jgi:hypothetical protein